VTEPSPRQHTSFVFDLDGTLVDSVYQHVLAWHVAIEMEGFDLSVWRIHRKIGMSGGLFTNMLLRENRCELFPRADRTHAAAPRRRVQTRLS
jgi:beta-phosphoglucomutase-like phosphatase (HAD superfamily)